MIIKNQENVATIITPELRPNEVIKTVDLLSSPSGLELEASVEGSTIVVNIGDGPEGAYLITASITTNFRTFNENLEVSVQPSNPDPDPDSYQDLVGELEAGKSALATVIFQFDPYFDLSSGYVVWELLDSEGTVYSSGSAYELKIKESGLNKIVIAKAIVSTPSNIPPTIDNPYQIRYSFKTDLTTSYQFENLRIYGFPDLQLGTQDCVEMRGDKATLSLVTESEFKNYVIEVYSGGKLLSATPVPTSIRVSNGYLVEAVVDTSNLADSLIPYQVIWKFWTNPNQIFRENSNLWIVNSDIIQAIEDIKSKINKARQTLYGTPDSQFPSTEILKWLRRGMDSFNGAYGTFTNFTMTHALGVVREFWLLCSERSALEAQLLLEGEKAFNFSGAAISLDVDKTGVLDNMIGKIESTLSNELPAIKKNLAIRGNTGGDGSGPNGDGNFSGSSRANVAAVGLLISPVSRYGGYSR